MVLRPEDIVEDILRSIRLARFDFLSFSSLVVDEEPAVGGGEKEPPMSRLDVLLRLPMDDARWTPGLLLVCVEGGRAGDKRNGDAAGGSIVIDRRRSENEARPWLISSFTTVTEDLRSLVVVAFEELDDLLSSIVSLAPVDVPL